MGAKANLRNEIGLPFISLLISSLSPLSLSLSLDGEVDFGL